MDRPESSATRIHYSLPDGSLYREDLERIVAVMRQLGDDVSLRVDRETFDDVGALGSAHRVLPNLEISVGRRFAPDNLRVTLCTPRFLRRESSHIEIGNVVNARMMEVAEQVRSIVTDRAVRAFPLANSDYVGLAGLVMILLLWLKDFDLSSSYLATVVLYFLFVAYVLGTWVITRFHYRPGVYTYYRGNNL